MKTLPKGLSEKEYEKILTIAPHRAGKHNKGIFICPQCGFNIMRDSNMFDHLVGISNTSHGKVFVVECPHCFEKFNFHVDDQFEYLIDAIEYGRNVHFRIGS